VKRAFLSSEESEGFQTLAKNSLWLYNNILQKERKENVLEAL